MSSSGGSSNKCTTCGKEFSSDEVICPDDGGILVAVKKDPAIGTIVADKYEIEDVIGGGGMGVVYKAKHQLMNRTVAIKMLLPETVANEYALARFRKEAEAAASLNHPNILTIFDFGITANKQPYLVMDYLKGHTLADVLDEEGYLHLQRGLSIFIQIASALAHAHQKGVVHRDLKPANIMLVEYEGKGDFVKIVDFGIAKTVHREGGPTVELTQTGQVFGSPLYMSPEQCRGTHLDARSDIYSMGCVMYRSATGESAFRGQDALELMFKHVNETPEKFLDCCPSLKLPQNFEEVVFKSLAKDPENRYQSMLDLRKDLEAVAGTSINSPFIFPAGEADASKTPKIGSLEDSRNTLNEYIAQTESQKQKAEEIALAQSKLDAEKAALRMKVLKAAAEGNTASGKSGSSPSAKEENASTVITPALGSEATYAAAATAGGTAAKSQIANTGGNPNASATNLVPSPTSITITASGVPSAETKPGAPGVTGATAALGSAAAAIRSAAAKGSPAAIPPGPGVVPNHVYGAGRETQHDLKKAILAPKNRPVVVGTAAGIVLIPLAVILLQMISSHKPEASKTSAGNRDKNTQEAINTATGNQKDAANALKMGNDDFDAGNYLQAKDALERARSLASLDKNLPIKYQSDLLLGQISLAEGNYDGARSSLYSLVNANNAEAGKNRPTDVQMATALNGLGVISTNQGIFDRAHEQFKQALALREKMPPKDADVWETLMGMGTLALYEHDYKKALDYLLKAKKISEDVNGPDHTDTAHILNDLGQAYQFLGKYTEANDCYTKALEIRKKNLKPGDPQIASTQMCMAALAFKKRDFQTSENLFLDALAIDSKALGTDNLLVSQIYFSLGVLYQEQKKYSNAIDYYQRALDIQKRKLDPANKKLLHTKQLLEQVKKKRH